MCGRIEFLQCLAQAREIHRLARSIFFHVAERIEVGMRFLQFSFAVECRGTTECMPRALDGIAQSEPALFVKRLLEHRKAAFEPLACRGAQALPQFVLAQQARHRRMPIVPEQRQAVSQRQAAPWRSQHADPSCAVAEVRQCTS